MSGAELAVDGLAVYRLTRLFAADTFPPIAKARDYLQNLYPQEGDRVDEDLVLDDDDLESDVRREFEGRGVLGERVVVPVTGSPETGWVADESSAVGELLSCRWCISMYVAAGALAFRRFAPRTWRALASVLAGSAVAGLLAGMEE